MRRNVIGLAVLSSVLFPLALPNELFPMGNPWLGLISLSPLYLAFLVADSPRQASLIGVIFGAISTVLANYWLMFFGDYSVWTIGGTTLGYIMYNAILGPFLWRSLRARAGYRVFLFSMVWTGYELLKSVGFLGYPWGLVAYPYNTVPWLIQIADVTGVWGLSFLAVAVCGILAELALDLARTRRVRPTTARGGIMIAILLVITVTYGIVSLNRKLPTKGQLDVLLVQQNADSWNTRDIARPLFVAQRLTHEGLDEALHVDLAVWSETSLRYPYDEFSAWYEKNPPSEPFAEFVKSLPVPLLTGSPFRIDTGEFTIYNASILIDQSGSIRQWYGKQQLVPFAEYVPFWESPVVQRFFQEVVGIGAIWAPGPGYRLFSIETDSGTTVNFGTPICFEDAFAYITRRFVRAGADMFINLTNNAWSLTDSAQLQHLVAARFRAVETRRSLVRSTNAGFTGVVDPWGRITHSVPMFVEAHLVASVPVYEGPSTIYVRWGEYLPIAMIAALLALLVVSLLRKRPDSWIVS